MAREVADSCLNFPGSSVTKEIVKLVGSDLLNSKRYSLDSYLLRLCNRRCIKPLGGKAAILCSAWPPLRRLGA